MSDMDPIRLDGARISAAVFLAQLDAGDAELQLAGDECARDLGWCWVVEWSTARWFATGDPTAVPPPGGGPIVVVKDTVDTWMLVSGTPYDEQLAAYAEANGHHHTVPFEAPAGSPADEEIEARITLARWLTARSAAPDSPWTVADLASWAARWHDECLLLEPPGYANTLFLVRGATVCAFRPTDESLDDAVARARAAQGPGDATDAEE